MPQAACVLLRLEDRVLAISRGLDRWDLGLPGGRVEPGEDLANAAIREMYEETGVRLAGVRPIFRAKSYIFTTTTFEPVGPASWPAVFASNPFEGFVTWAKPMDLCSPSCSHAPYQRALFAHLRIG